MVEVEPKTSAPSLEEEEEPTSLSPIVEDDDSEEMTQYELQCAAWEHASSDMHGLLDYEELRPRVVEGSARGAHVHVQAEATDEVKGYASKPSGAKGDWTAQTEELVHAEITIPINKVGLLIGRGGRTIKSLQERTRTRMHIIQDMSKFNAEDPSLDAADKTLIITGTQESVIQAEELIYDFISKAPSTPPPIRHKEIYTSENDLTGTPGQPYASEYNESRRSSFSARNSNRSGRVKTIRMPVPKIAVGLIIGKGGDSIKRIRMETGAKVQFNPLTSSMSDMDDQMAVITGRAEQIQHACDLIEELVDTAMNTKPGEDNGQRRRLRSENLVGSSTGQVWGQGQEWSQGQDWVAEDQSQRPSQPEVPLDAEEERMSIPVEKVRKVIGKGREVIRNISLISGANCELDRMPVDGPERVIIISGQRSQIDHAKGLILERINFVGNEQHQVNEQVFTQPLPEQFGPGQNLGQEWAQEQPAPWSYYEPAYYDPIQLGYQDYYMNVPANSSGDYSQWAQYFHPPPDPQQPPNPSWAGPGHQGQEPKPDPIPPVPIMSATIVQNTDRSSPYATPPTVYFSIPTSPFHPPMNIPTGHAPAPAPAQEHQPQPTEAEQSEKASEGSDPQANNPDGDHPEKEAQPAPVKASEDPCASGGGDHKEPSEPKEGTDPSVQPPPGFEPYRVIPPNAVPGLSYPSNIGTPGSCTRIVSFYYDMNVNSIVILNQWHFY